jgi:NitT/TauT family transport system substrate-binding protein
VKRWSSATAALIALALSSCARTGEPRARLAVATVRQPATSLFAVGSGEGCFHREGLELDEQAFQLGRDALERLRAGAVDVAISYETPLLRAALADGRLRVLTKLHTSAANTRLVTRAQAGIGGFSALRGKRIGLPRGTNAEFFAEVAIAEGNVPRASVDVRDLAPAEAVAALGRGEVDGAVLSDPYATDAEQLLGPAARTLLTDLYVEASLLVTREDVLAAKEPALRALVRGLACAERLARDRPGEARALVAASFPEQQPGDVAAQLDRVAWGLGLDHVLVDALRRERDWLVTSAPGAHAPDLRQLVTAQVLDEVYPESVTLLPGTESLRW